MIVNSKGVAHDDECALLWWHYGTCWTVDDEDTGFWPTPYEYPDEVIDD